MIAVIARTYSLAIFSSNESRADIQNGCSFVVLTNNKTAWCINHDRSKYMLELQTRNLNCIDNYDVVKIKVKSVTDHQ